MMLMISRPEGNIGPFKEVQTLVDRYRCDGVDYQFSVIGEGAVISEAQPGDFPPTAAEIDALRQRKKDLLPQIHDAKLKGSIVVSGMRISLDTDSKAIFALAKTNSRASRKVCTKAGDRAILTAAQFDGLVATIENYGQDLMNKAYDLSEALDAATTVEELNAIDVEAGWPQG